MTGATSPRVEWNCAFIDADYENEFCSGVPDAGIANRLRFLALLRTEMSSCERKPHPSPTIKVTTAVGKQEQSATRPDGWTVVVALNTVGSSEPTR
jgi:hypothetical protein